MTEKRKSYKGDLDTELFRTDPCRFLEDAIKEYDRTSPLNHLTAFENDPIVEEPIVAFADGNDPIFQDFKNIIGEFHLTPREILEKYPFYQDESCRLCMEHCPGSAISKEGMSNIACLKNLRDEQTIKVKNLGLDEDLIGPAPSCGRCSTGVPCEVRIPPLVSRKDSAVKPSSGQA
jgi:hypothetical protein